MDKIETLSDCSEISGTSECLSSDISISSNLSEYQSEFLHLKRLINTENDQRELKNHKSESTSIVPWYEKQIEQLKLQLQNSLKDGDKHKNNAYKLEQKNNFLSEKIEKLLQHNKQLEENLSGANNQIQRLISIYHKKDDIEEKILQLEKINQGLVHENQALLNKVSELNFQKNEIQNELKNLKTENNEIKLELSAKINGVNELKRKISEQHVELQQLSQNNVKLTHSLSLVTNELEYVKKSESWYKNELRQFQKEKTSFHEKILENEKTIAFKEDKLEQLNLELSSLKCSCDEIRLAAFKERETLLKQFQSTNSGINNTRSTNVDRENVDLGSITNHYESVINDLTSDVMKLKSDFEHQQRCFENVSTEKTDIMGRYLSLQNRIKERDDAIETLDNNNKILKEKLSSANNKQKEQASELLDLKKTCVKLQLDLSLRETFEESVSKIKDQFKVISGKYVQLQEEVQKKNREILDNNREISELKLNAYNGTMMIDKLNQRIVCLQQIVTDKDFVCNKHLETISELNAKLAELHTIINNLESKALDKCPTSNSLDSLPSEVNVIKYVCKLCKMDENIYINSTENCTLNKNHCVQLLSRLESYFNTTESVMSSKTDTEINQRKKSNERKKCIISKILKLRERCKTLETNNEESLTMLKLFRKESSLSEEVLHLQTQLQVKLQEEKDKQKRYEKNYRTLLRKVKEHMKGRKTAEKHNAYLQELYDSLSDECNTLRLKVASHQTDMYELQRTVENYANTNQKLKASVMRLEKELSEKNADFDKFKKNEIDKSMKNFENSKFMKLMADLKTKEDLTENLQKQNDRMYQEISSKNLELEESAAIVESLSQDNKKLKDQLLDLENKLIQNETIIKQLRTQVYDAEADKVKIQNENIQLSGTLDHTREKNLCLLQDITNLNSRLQRKTEEINELVLRKEQSSSRWVEKEANLLRLIASLKNQVYTFRMEIDTIKNEKFFLQRLCNDLKVALKTHLTHNKILKEFFERLCKDKEHFGNNSFAVSNFPRPVICDDIYIDKLLQENKEPIQDKPFCDIQECLNTLRKEIYSLQKQIVDKNDS